MDTQDAFASVTMLPSRPKVEGKKLPQYIFTLAAGLCALAGGSAVSWTAPALPYLESANSTIPVTHEEGSWVGALLPVGALIGGLPAGSCADRLGRKISVLALGVPLVISWVMILFGNAVWILYLARLLAGFAVGASCAVVPMYISEIAEDSIRGKLGSYFQIMLVFGIVYSYVMGAFCSYRVLTVVNGILPILFMIAFFKAPETPTYLLRKNKRAEAQVAMLRLRGNGYDVFSELNRIQNEIDKELESQSSFFEACAKRESIRSMIICFGLMLFQQLCGVNAVVFYTKGIFIDAGSTLDPAIATILVGIAQLSASYASAMLIEKAGRKILLLVSSAVMAVCLGVMGIYFHLKDSGKDVTTIGFIPVITVIVYMLTFSVGFGPIPWLMTSEILPQDIKGVATGIAVAFNWALAFVVTKTFQDLVDAFGSAATFWVFGVVCILGVIFVAFLVLETKGKSVYQIQEELRGKKRPKVNINNNEIP